LKCASFYGTILLVLNAPPDLEAQAPATREDWLRRATDGLRPDFLRRGLSLPERLQVSIGFPSTRALSTRRRRIGECWAPQASRDGAPHIFISPLIHSAVDVLEVHVHELVHAAVGVEAGHGSRFRRAALDLGLQGKMTATTAGDLLRHRLDDLARQLGPFPHGALRAEDLDRRRQGTRLLRVACPACGYLIRTTAKWVAAGLPTCPCGFEMRLEDV
jgi:hypothetical protein